MNEPTAASGRGSLWVELGLVLLVIWLPLAAVGRVVPQEPIDAPGLLAYSTLTLAGSLALVHFLVWRAGEPFRRLGWRPIRFWRELGWGLLLYGAAWILVRVYERVLPSTPDPTAPDYLGAPTFLNIVNLLLGALFEESFYRGLLFDRLRRLSRSGALAVVVSSVLFAAAHPYGLRDLVWVFLFGLLLALSRLQGRSLTRLVLAHFGFNVSLFFA